MTVELDHPYEQMAEQIMYARGASSLSDVLSQAIMAMHGSLSAEEKHSGLQKMVQAGLDSGLCEGNPLHEILARLRPHPQEDIAA